jgi:predicted nuclease of predicted toxin-antitoxin system
MKLLFDQNISFRIVKSILKYYPESKQVSELGLDNYSDIKIWKYAKTNDYSIVTFDGDFKDLATLYGHPPKIIWLRFGNTSTKNIAELLKSKQEIIKDFLQKENYKDISCLEFWENLVSIK